MSAILFNCLSVGRPQPRDKQKRKTNKPTKTTTQKQTGKRREGTKNIGRACTDNGREN